MAFFHDAMVWFAVCDRGISHDAVAWCAVLIVAFLMMSWFG